MVLAYSLRVAYTVPVDVKGELCGYHWMVNTIPSHGNPGSLK